MIRWHMIFDMIWHDNLICYMIRWYIWYIYLIWYDIYLIWYDDISYIYDIWYDDMIYLIWYMIWSMIYIYIWYIFDMIYTIFDMIWYIWYLIYDMIYLIRYMICNIYLLLLGPPLVAATLMYRFKIDLFYPVYFLNETASKIYHDNRWHFQFSISVLHNFNSTAEVHTKWVAFAKRSGHWKCHIKIQRFVHFRQLFDPSQRARRIRKVIRVSMSSRGWRM